MLFPLPCGCGLPPPYALREEHERRARPKHASGLPTYFCDGERPTYLASSRFSSLSASSCCLRSRVSSALRCCLRRKAARRFAISSSAFSSSCKVQICFKISTDLTHSRTIKHHKAELYLEEEPQHVLGLAVHRRLCDICASLLLVLQL